MTDEFDIYSQEEINQAREDLKAMTPEDLLAMREQLDRATNNLNIPEAVSICFTEVYSSKGNKVNITCRGMTGRQAIDELAETLRYAREKYGMQPAHHSVEAPPPASNEVRYVPDEQSAHQEDASFSTVDIDVTSITRERKRDGKGDFLRVRGGMYTKYGVPAYDNIFPKTFDITKLTYGVEVTQIPSEISRARVDTRKPGTKVVQFI